MTRSVALLTVGFCLAAWTVSGNDNETPLFDDPITIHDVVYSWSSADDNGTYRTDVYSDGLTIVSLLSEPSRAHVSGGSENNISGFISGGSYFDATEVAGDDPNYSSSGSRTTTQRTLDLVTGNIACVITTETWTTDPPESTRVTTYDGMPGEPEIHMSWGDDNFAEYRYPSMAAMTASRNSGNLASQASFWKAFSRNSNDDGNGSSTTTETWTGSPGAWGNMSIPRTRTQTLSSGSIDDGPQIELFGKTFVEGSYFYETVTDTANGLSTSSNSTNYHGPSGAVFSTTTSFQNLPSPTTTQSFSGWDPDIGSFSTTNLPNLTGPNPWASVNWNRRQDPTFAPAVLGVNGQLFIWQGGTLQASGVITDTYAHPASNTVLTIQAHVPDFKNNGVPADMVLNSTSIASLDHVGTITAFGSDSIDFNGPWHNSSTPRIAPATLWINATAYTFVEGYSEQDPNEIDPEWEVNHRFDHYRNLNAGSIFLGWTTDSSQSPIGGSIQVHGRFFDTHFTGTWPGPLSHGVVLSTSPPPPDFVPKALWIRGHTYTRTTPAGNSFSCAAGSLSLTFQSALGTFHLSGHDQIGSFSGTLPNTYSLSVISGSGTEKLVVIPLGLDQNNELALLFPPVVPPQGLPPGIRCHEVHYSLLGQVSLAPGSQVAVYACKNHPDTSPSVFCISTSASINIAGKAFHATTVTPGSSVITTSTGTWSANTRLFQTSGPGSSFPNPIRAIDTGADNTHWRLTLPANYSHPLAPSFIVRGQPWWYAGLDAQGDPLYHGFYHGQVLKLTPNPVLPSQLLVHLTDPIHNAGASDPNITTNGAFNDLRGSIRLRDGTVIFPGNDEGARHLASFSNDHRLHTIDGDLDILGNTFSFGLLNGDASLAGTVFQFTDDLIPGSSPPSYLAGLHNNLSRSLAEWTWRKVSLQSDDVLTTVMHLDTQHRLHLTSPESPNTGITLNPASGGTSSLPGTLRVRPGGDLSMGQYRAGGEP